MNPRRKRMDTMPERYDQALAYGRERNLPAEAPRPKPTRDWPAENVALLTRYAEWLTAGGYSEEVIRTNYVPFAGHVLGLFLKPHPQLDLQNDLQPALEYVKAKGAGADWLDTCRVSLEKFRRFLRHTRGLVEVKAKPYSVAVHTQGLPEWLVSELEHYQRICQRNWRPARLEENIRRFWSGHLRVWRFLCEQRGVQTLADVQRKDLYAYVDHRLQQGTSVSTLNADLRGFTSFLVCLQEQEYPVPQALLHIQSLKQPEALPKYLTDEQVCALCADFEGQVGQAQSAAQRRDALLNRAFFYLLWQSGLRKGEVEELRLEDLDLARRKLSVRNGKGMKDRTVYLTDTSVNALSAYLALRGMGPTDHVFLYRNQPLGKDLIHGRLKAAGERAGVKVHAHRLRHTAATQLLNAGCPVTSIQKFLGHKKLNTTMGYARAHDQTVEADYFAAMQRVEARLALAPVEEEPAASLGEEQHQELLALAEQLAQPEISTEQRLALAQRLWVILTSEKPCSTLPTASPLPSANSSWLTSREHPPLAQCVPEFA